MTISDRHIYNRTQDLQRCASALVKWAEHEMRDKERAEPDMLVAMQICRKEGFDFDVLYPMLRAYKPTAPD